MSGNSLTLVLLKTQIKNICHTTNVNIKSEKITPFGGIYYASKAFYALLLDKVINGTLGVRSSAYNGYQWNEMKTVGQVPVSLLTQKCFCAKFIGKKLERII